MQNWANCFIKLGFFISAVITFSKVAPVWGLLFLVDYDLFEVFNGDVSAFHR